MTNNSGLFILEKVQINLELHQLTLIRLATLRIDNHHFLISFTFIERFLFILQEGKGFHSPSANVKKEAHEEKSGIIIVVNTV